MRIGLISGARGGGVRHVNAKLASNFLARDFDVAVANPFEGEPFFHELDPRIGFFRLGSKSNPLAFTRSLVRFQKEFKPDICICSQDLVIVPFAFLKAMGLVDALAIGIIHNNPIVHERHEKILANMIPLFSRWAYHQFDHIVAVSGDLRRKLVDSGLVPETQSTTIYNPVIDLPVAIGASGAADQSLNNGRPFLVSAGNLVEQKDTLTLVRAFKLLTDKYPGDLLLLGEGPLREAITREIAELGLEGRVRLLGFVENPIDYFAQADLFALSSRWEGFGIVLVEAMSVGCPVVSTDCDFGPREILANGDFGKLVQVGNVEELAAAVLEELANPTPKPRLMERALKFSVSASMDKYCELIEAMTRA